MTVQLMTPGATRRVSKRRSPQAVSRLVRAAADGDERAWNELVDEFVGLLWTIARAYRLDEADAADVVQSTWLRLLEHVGRLRDPARVGDWLATTARRECLRVLRESDRTLLFGEHPPECESADPPFADVVLAHERDEALRRGFARLRCSDQALLRLLVAEPRPSYEEIASALDMPIGSIGPTRQRALERLRQELDEQGSLMLLTA
jgi:RNA polymerase sigma factor (sigma-70 family)